MSMNEIELGGVSALSRKRLADQIADVLRDQILLGEFAPGKNIPERETSKALGVSRTPLREALLILEGEGLIEMAPTRSPVVANPSVEDVTQLIQVQAALEALAGACACDKITSEEFDQIEEMHLAMLAAAEDNTSLQFFSSDMAFHKAVVAASKNTPLIRTHSQYHGRLWRVRFVSSRKQVKKRSVTLAEHGNIVEGLRLRDKAQTSVGLEQHLTSAIANLPKVMGVED